MADGTIPSGLMTAGFMSNPMLMDPQIQASMARQQYAQALMGQGMQTSPVISPWQAAARGIQGALGGYEMGQSFQNLQDYATASRKALGEFYGSQPIVTPPIPAYTPPSTVPTPSAAPQSSLAPPGSPNKQVVLADIARRESGNDPTAGYPTDKNGNVLSSATGAYQILKDTWKEGAGFAGVDTSQYPEARNAPLPVQTQVASALFDRYGERPWAASAPGATTTTFATSTQPPGPAPEPPGQAQTPQAAARDYGVQMARVMQQRAAEAAQSPYAAVRALAPQLMQQAAQYAQFGRFQPLPNGPSGETMVLDTATGEPKQITGPLSREILDRQDQSLLDFWQPYVRAGRLNPDQMQRYTSALNRQNPVALADDPSTGAKAGMRAPSAWFVPPGAGGAGPAVGGSEGQLGQPQLGPGAEKPPITAPYARANNVSTPPGPDIYGGMPYIDAQKQRQKNIETAQARADAVGGDVNAANTLLTNIQQMRALLARHVGPFGGATGTSLFNKAMQLTGHYFLNSDDQAEFKSLADGMIPGMRAGSGINTVANKDMGIFEGQAPGLDKSVQANTDILDRMEWQAKRLIEHNSFMHDYADANGTMIGAESAWNKYVQANPVFAYNEKGEAMRDDNTGRFLPNPNAQGRRQWFDDNTDENTGRLLTPAQLAKKQAPSPAAPQQQQAPQGQPPPFNAANNANATVTGDDGSVWRSDGRSWQRVR